MARVTVEDCLKNVKNRFELVILSAKRARQLMHGKEAKVAWDNDKPTVVALREIAAGFTDFTTHETTVETPALTLHMTTDQPDHTDHTDHIDHPETETPTIDHPETETPTIDQPEDVQGKE